METRPDALLQWVAAIWELMTAPIGTGFDFELVPAQLGLLTGSPRARRSPRLVGFPEAVSGRVPTTVLCSIMHVERSLQ